MDWEDVVEDGLIFVWRKIVETMFCLGVGVMTVLVVPRKIEGTVIVCEGEKGESVKARM